LSESAISEIKIRLDKSMKERDLALQEAQDISDKYENLKKERNQLVESCNEYQQHLEELQDQLEEVTQNYYSAAQDGNSELLQSQLDEANDKLEQKIRELHEMKEKVNGLEEQLYVDESQRGTGEVISALEREKLELQELVMELQNREESSNDNATEEGRLLREALQAKEQENEFLNSVIVELKTKIETLEMLNGLGEQADVLKYASEDDLLGSGLPPPRLFCDICDEFDVHDTGDCPMQAQTESPLPSRHHGMRNNERPYCENCEVFGHWTDDCQYEETY
jgi:CAP-Gly domain-containing linker protein 1